LKNLQEIVPPLPAVWGVYLDKLCPHYNCCSLFSNSIRRLTIRNFASIRASPVGFIRQLSHYENLAYLSISTNNVFQHEDLLKLFLTPTCCPKLNHFTMDLMGDDLPETMNYLILDEQQEQEERLIQEETIIRGPTPAETSRFYHAYNNHTIF
jgi:hypothetical protein